MSKLHGNLLPPGTPLGEFEITGLVGEGGFSAVYLAWDRSLERTIALKEYMPAALAVRTASAKVQASSPRQEQTFQAGLRSFINEGKLLARFDHPALLKVYRFWEANGTAYMAMPYYKGPTLKQAVAAMAQPPDEAWLMALLDPLTLALAVLHEQQCYHRDIAPDNILLVEPSGLPLLLDFGAARRVIGEGAQTLTVILKQGYAPIEQYAQDAQDTAMRQGPWTDIYALAAVVHWAITGRTPPVAVGRVLGDSYQPLVLGAAGRYSPQFLHAIDQALAVLPGQRTACVADLRQALGLGQALGARSEPREPVVAPPLPRPAPAIKPAPTPVAAPTASPKRRAHVAAVAGLVACTVIGAVAWWALRAPVPANPGVGLAPVAPRPIPVAPVQGAVPAPLPVRAPAPTTQAPAPAPAQPRQNSPSSTRSSNLALCAQLIQRLSLGEDAQEIGRQMKQLSCKG